MADAATCDVDAFTPVQNGLYVDGSATVHCTTNIVGDFHICMEYNGVILPSSCRSFPMVNRSVEDGYAFSACLPGVWRTQATLHFLDEVIIDYSPSYSTGCR